MDVERTWTRKVNTRRNSGVTFYIRLHYCVIASLSVQYKIGQHLFHHPARCRQYMNMSDLHKLNADVVATVLFITHVLFVVSKLGITYNHDNGDVIIASTLTCPADAIIFTAGRVDCHLLYIG